MANIPLLDIPKPWEDHGWLESGEPFWCPENWILPKSIIDVMDSGDTGLGDSETLEEIVPVLDDDSDEDRDEEEDSFL